MKIKHVVARRIWDSRGRPTVEVEITNEDGTSGLGFAPAGASRGTREAVELRDGGVAFKGLDVQAALRGIEREIAPLLVGRDVEDQAGIDAALIALDGTPNKARLGGNALIAASLECFMLPQRLRVFRCGAIWRRAMRQLCRCRRFRSSVGVRMPAAAPTFRISW